MSEADSERSDRSRIMQRYWMLNAARLLGVALVMLGAMVLGERLAAPEWAAAALMIGGAAIFFFLPFALARHWRKRGS